MPEAATLLVFAAAAAALVAVPGPMRPQHRRPHPQLLLPAPNVVYIATLSVSQGRRSGLASALRIETGTLVHVAAAAVGLSALLASSALAFAAVQYAGAAYLVFLGLRALLRHEAPGETAVAPQILALGATAALTDHSRR